MRLGIIFACDGERGIGKDGGMPWHHPEDLQQFKDATMGCPIIMGRKTWESFGGRMLPGRPHIVVSSQAPESFVVPDRNADFYVAASLEEAKATAEAIIEERSLGQWAWVIGGARLIEQALMHASKVRITFIKEDHDCDVSICPAFFNHIMVNRLARNEIMLTKHFNVVEYLM